MTKWEMRFKNETGRCPYNDIQYFADWLQREMSKLTILQQRLIRHDYTAYNRKRCAKFQARKQK